MCSQARACAASCLLCWPGVAFRVGFSVSVPRCEEVHVLLRRAVALFLAVLLLVLSCGPGVAGPLVSNRLVLKFPGPWRSGGAVGKQLFVRAGDSADLPVRVSERDLLVLSDFYLPGTRVAAFRGNLLLGAGRAGESGLSAKLLSPVSDGEVVGLVEGEFFRVVQVARGGWHSLVLLFDGRVMATNRTTPPAPVVGLTGVVRVAAGWHHSLALLSDGTVVAWGGQ